MKLTKLYIHNYKSFYDTTIELDKMNIVVGENNSGKSNLIDVLEFLTIAVDNMDNAISLAGGFEKILNYNYNEDTIYIEYELESDLFLIKSRLTISKKLIVISRIDYGKIENEYLPIGIDIIRNKKRRFYSFDKNKLKLNSYIGYNIKYKLDVFTMLFSIADTYSFNIEEIRNKSYRSFGSEFKHDGSNLGEILYGIKEKNPNKFEIISNSLIGVVDEISGIDVQKVFSNYTIGFHEKNKDIGIDIVSDGTINFLATMTALNKYNNESPWLLAFDEPERYLHLKAVNYMLQAFRDSEKQILITTHSTEILKYANLEEIIFIYRDEDGDTQSIRADKVDGLQDMLKELAYERDLTLDELIADGIIGDFK